MAALLLCMPSAWAVGDAKRGQIIANVRCAPCHFLSRKEKKIGPGLLAVYDRAPSIRGVPFARWDDQALDQWLSGPRRVKANTPMVLPAMRAADRADVITFLKRQSVTQVLP